MDGTTARPTAAADVGSGRTGTSVALQQPKAHMLFLKVRKRGTVSGVAVTTDDRKEESMRRNVLLLVVGLMVVGATTGLAEEQGIIDQVMQACKPEIDSYCSQVTLGEGRLLACFYAHEDKLSGRCQYALYEAAATLDAFAAAVTHLAEACWDDVEKYCAEVELGEGRVGTCLLEHKDEVTEPCRQAIDDVGLEMVEE